MCREGSGPYHCTEVHGGESLVEGGVAGIPGTLATAKQIGL